jgi:restriction endonuclease Mrr
LTTTRRTQDIDNIDTSAIPTPQARAEFQPVALITADVDAIFETSVGVIHRINETDRFVVHARLGRPDIIQGAVRRLVAENRRQTIDLDEEEFADVFDTIDVHRFGQTETEYKGWAVNRLQERHTTTVSYTGDNNVTYIKTCEPNQSDISVQSITPIYLLEIRQTTHLQQYECPYEYYAAGPSRVTVEDGIHRYVYCETAGQDTDYTYCANCGSISCPDHTKTERLEQAPVGTGLI